MLVKVSQVKVTRAILERKVCATAAEVPRSRHKRSSKPKECKAHVRPSKSFILAITNDIAATNIASGCTASWRNCRAATCSTATKMDGAFDLVSQKKTLRMSRWLIGGWRTAGASGCSNFSGCVTMKTAVANSLHDRCDSSIRR